MIYSREAMCSELDQLVREARHVMIVPEKLRDVAMAMRQELAVADTSFQTDPQ